MSKPTPTISEIRAAYAVAMYGVTSAEERGACDDLHEQYEAAFDAALAAHDAEVRSHAEAVVAMSAYDDGYTAGEAAGRASVVPEEPEGER